MEGKTFRNRGEEPHHSHKQKSSEKLTPSPLSKTNSERIKKAFRKPELRKKSRGPQNQEIWERGSWEEETNFQRIRKGGEKPFERKAFRGGGCKGLPVSSVARGQEVLAGREEKKEGAFPGGGTIWRKKMTPCPLGEKCCNDVA